MFRSPGAIAFHAGPFTIRWYGILMATAIAVGCWVASREARRSGLDSEKVLGAGQWAIIAGLVGARIYEVIFNWDYYGRYPEKIVAVWEGGLAMHGGLIAGILVGLWMGRRNNVPLLPGLDVAALSIVVGQAIGRWGNFFNEEAFGRPTDLPWKLYIPPPQRPLPYLREEFFHPTFLYESLWDLAVFGLLVLVFRRRLERSPGTLFLVYLGLYSAGRFWVEGLRTDSLMLGSVRVAQLVSLIGMALAVALVPLLLRRAPRS